MKLKFRADKSANYGRYEILFEKEPGNLVYISEATKMYYSGHGYHSMNDTNYSFSADLFKSRDQAHLLYVKIEQHKTDKSGPCSTIQVYCSKDGGASWSVFDTSSLDEKSWYHAGKAEESK